RPAWTPVAGLLPVTAGRTVAGLLTGRPVAGLLTGRTIAGLLTGLAIPRLLSRSAVPGLLSRGPISGLLRPTRLLLRATRLLPRRTIAWLPPGGGAEGLRGLFTPGLLAGRAVARRLRGPLRTGWGAPCTPVRLLLLWSLRFTHMVQARSPG